MEGVENVVTPQMLHLYLTVYSFRDWNILLTYLVDTSLHIHRYSRKRSR